MVYIYWLGVATLLYQGMMNKKEQCQICGTALWYAINNIPLIC